MKNEIQLILSHPLLFGLCVRLNQFVVFNKRKIIDLANHYKRLRDANEDGWMLLVIHTNSSAAAAAEGKQHTKIFFDLENSPRYLSWAYTRRVDTQSFVTSEFTFRLVGMVFFVFCVVSDIRCCLLTLLTQLWVEVESRIVSITIQSRFAFYDNFNTEVGPIKSLHQDMES